MINIYVEVKLNKVVRTCNCPELFNCTYYFILTSIEKLFCLIIYWLPQHYAFIHTPMNDWKCVIHPDKMTLYKFYKFYWAWKINYRPSYMYILHNDEVMCTLTYDNTEFWSRHWSYQSHRGHTQPHHQHFQHLWWGDLRDLQSLLLLPHPCFDINSWHHLFLWLASKAPSHLSSFQVLKLVNINW